MIYVWFDVISGDVNQKLRNFPGIKFITCQLWSRLGQQKGEPTLRPVSIQWGQAWYEGKNQACGSFRDDNTYANPIQKKCIYIYIYCIYLSTELTKI